MPIAFLILFLPLGVMTGLFGSFTWVVISVLGLLGSLGELSGPLSIGPTLCGVPILFLEWVLLFGWPSYAG